MNNNRYKKALELACRHIEECAEPDCGNCPLTSCDGSICPAGEDMTERCREFIKDGFLKEADTELNNEVKEND